MGSTRLRQALLRIQDELWDDDAALTRMPPGATPGVDLAPFNLHFSRDTMLSAHLDLATGRTARAERAIRSVLRLQYDAPGTPWHGTFKVAAEEQDPPAAGAVEWINYDPNWRQFIGCALADILVLHEQELSPDLVPAMDRALSLCVDGEPDDRIADSYTNPNLMYAWLAAWVGIRQERDDFVRAGVARRQMLVERFERFGDLDEYNSPTYDGVNLFALALWVASPPDEAFAVDGARLLSHLTERIGTLFHPGIGALCGPYIRSYGFDLARYVSLVGQWLAVAGTEECDAMPEALDPGTDHVHDLFFVTMFESLRDRASIAVPIRPVVHGRDHRQVFGEAVATSHLDPSFALGIELGRVHRFARDQYAPIVFHELCDGEPVSCAVKLEANVRSVDGSMTSDRSADVSFVSDGTEVGIVVVSSLPPQIADGTMSLGSLAVHFEAPPSMLERSEKLGTHVTQLGWRSKVLRARVQVTS